MMQHYNLGILRVHPRFIGEGDEKPADKTYTQAELDAHVQGLKNKNDQLLGKITKFKDLPDDATPEEIKAAIEFKRKTEKEELEAKGKYDELLRKMGEQHTTEKRSLEEKLTQKEQRIISREKKIAAKDAIRDLEGKEQWLLPHILPMIAVEENGDEYDSYITDGKGNAVMKADGTKKTVKDLLGELREDPKWKDAFLAPDVAGSGARGGSRQAAGGSVRLSRAEGKDPAKYRAAKELAAKNGGEVIWTD